MKNSFSVYVLDKPADSIRKSNRWFNFFLVPVLLFLSSPSAGYDCKAPDINVVKAINEATIKGESGGVATSYCATVNIARAVIWNSLQCLNDKSLSAEELEQVHQQLVSTRANMNANMDAFSQVAIAGATCTCWSDFCAE